MLAVYKKGLIDKKSKERGEFSEPSGNSITDYQVLNDWRRASEE